ELARIEAALLLVHVFAVLDDGKDRGVSGWPPDAFLFQRLHQRRLVKARWRLRKVLLGSELAQLQRLALLDGGKRMLQLLVFRHLRFFVLALFVNREKALELEDRTCGPKHVISRR